jgi:hypothetical protein
MRVNKNRERCRAARLFDPPLAQIARGEGEDIDHFLERCRRLLEEAGAARRRPIEPESKASHGTKT